MKLIRRIIVLALLAGVGFFYFNQSSTDFEADTLFPENRRQSDSQEISIDSLKDRVMAFGKA